MDADRHTVLCGATATEAAGHELGAVLRPGDIVLVEGEMGAGKTTFIRGVCRALGYEGAVTSPSFTLAHRYPGAIEIAHLDLQRLAALGGEDEGLVDDHTGAGTVTLIEWPRAALALLPRPPRMRVVLAHGERSGERILQVDAGGDASC